MRPYFCCVMLGRTARVMRKGSVQCNGNLVLPFREGRLDQRLAIDGPAGLGHAALFTRMSMRPRARVRHRQIFATSVSTVRSAMKKGLFTAGVEFASASVNAVRG